MFSCQELGHQSWAFLYSGHVLRPQPRTRVGWSTQPDLGVPRLVQQHMETRGLKEPLLTGPAESLIGPDGLQMP